LGYWVNDRQFSSSIALLLLLALPSVESCRRREPPRKYQLTGQVLAVNKARGELIVKHEDIPNFMPAMTMTYPAAPELLDGRAPGELISATLSVQDANARLIAITHTGSAPLPTTNEAALAEGILAEGDQVPDVALIDQNNRRRSLSEWQGTFTLLTFIYTRCPFPNFCPLMDQNFATIQRAVAEERLLKGQVKLVSVTIDPENDTPTVLAAHAATRHADPAVWTFLTGDRVTVHRFAGRFGIGVIRPEGVTEIEHNLRTALIGRDGRLRRTYSGNDWTPSTVLSDIRAALTLSNP
jgi:protein SCO1/2